MRNTLLDAGKTTVTGIIKGRGKNNHEKRRWSDPSQVYNLIAQYSGHLMICLRFLPSLKTEYVSPSCQTVLGYSPQELYANPGLLMDSLHPEDTEKFWAFEHQEKISPCHRVSLRWIRKDGRIIWTDLNAIIIRNGENRPEVMYIMASDITERKMAEEKLRESQKFITGLLENAPHAIMVINPDTSIRYVNPTWEETNGWKLEDVIGIKAPYPWWPEEMREEFSKNFSLAMRQKGSGEVIAQKKNGERYWLSMNWTPVTRNGELQYLLVNSIDITERLLAEKALKESEDLFSKAFRTSPDIMAIVGLKDGRFIEVNDTLMKFSGYNRDELIGHQAEELDMFVHPEDRDKILNTINQEGSLRHAELSLKMKSGEIRTWLCSADTITIKQEPCLLFVATDITERKKALEALRESEEKFAKAFQASPASISISRLSDGRFIEVNEAFLRDKAYRRKEVIGRTSKELNLWVYPNDRERTIRILKGGGRVDNEIVRFRTKAGEIRTGLVSADLINIGGEECLLVLNTDITRQQQTEEKLRLLSSVTQQVSDATIVIDLEFKINYINNGAEKLYGYTASEVLGKDISIFNSRPIPPKTARQIHQIVRSGNTWQGVVPKKRKDGRIILCDCRLTPLLDENGRAIAYIDISHDVTAQKEMEARLNDQKRLVESILATMPEGVLVINHNNEVLLANQAFYQIFRLRKRTTTRNLIDDIMPREKLANLYLSLLLGERTKDDIEFRYRAGGLEKIISCKAVPMEGGKLLMIFADVTREKEEEEKLYLTDRLASLGEMSAGLAHELNNPLTGILSLSQLLLQGDIPEEQKEDIRCIYEEAKRAAGIVKNVLLFARNSPSENGHSSANEVVLEVLRLRQHQEKTDNITVITRLQPDLPPIAIEKYQLQQVCLNIILNAEAAIQETGRPGTITIETKRQRNNVIISFSDSGCGIKKNILPRIFDPFFTTKEVGKGTGLGLSICYGIVVKHGGRIDVKTKVNEGSTFTVTLPIAS